MPADFVDTPKQEIDDILTININGTVRVTYAILPGMIARYINLVFVNAIRFSVLIQTVRFGYQCWVFRRSGTRSYVDHILWHQSFPFIVYRRTCGGSQTAQRYRYTYKCLLRRNCPVSVTTVPDLIDQPAQVSKLSKIRKASMLVPTAAVYVQSVLSKIGLSCGAAYSGRPHTSTPYWSHALVDYFMSLVAPKDFFVRYGHRMQKSIRIRALKKLQKESKAQ
jgi:17beta-estradiol 17-dehydrogenase / very-long-chain 3-oxoacyl-CoA reductase